MRNLNIIFAFTERGRERNRDRDREIYLLYIINLLSKREKETYFYFLKLFKINSLQRQKLYVNENYFYALYKNLLLLL